MPPIDVVSDASVALKWFHEEGEAEVDDARRVLDAYADGRLTLHILDLTRYEIGNALLRGRPGLSAASVATVLDALDEICPSLAPTAVELRLATVLAEQHGLTLYDAAYAAAAQVRGGVLATVDRDLLRAGLGLRPGQIVAQLTADEQ
jgi:predicted nucleic acid-binding protein